MGGTGDGVGNITAAAELNIWVDAEAAAIVHGAGARLVQVGWDIFHRLATSNPPGPRTRGPSAVLDHTGYTARPRNTHVVLEASRERFVALLKGRLREG